MQTKYINEMLDLPELKIRQILSIDAGEVHIEAVPLGDKQCCPCCGSDQDVIRKGKNDTRRVRYLSIFEKKRICTCRLFGGIVHAAKRVLYGRMNLSDPSRDTVSSSVRSPLNKPWVLQSLTVPVCNKRRPARYSACITRRFQRSASGSMHKCGKKPKTWKIWCWASMTSRTKKAIRITPASTTSKAKRCSICCWGKLEELRAYAQTHPDFLWLSPKAVVMDLAQPYHTWIRECFSECDSHRGSFSCS